MSETTLDHLVYGVPELEKAVSELTDRLGVAAVYGGQHDGWGTHNAIMSLGKGAYLEIIAPDPSQPAPVGGLPFGLDRLSGPRLLTWAVRVSEIEERVTQAREAGFDPGRVSAMSRNLAGGGRLSWKLTPAQSLGDGLVPFLIDWGSSSHPGTGASSGCSLLKLRGEHPNPSLIQYPLRVLGVTLQISEAPSVALVATLRGPKGMEELV